MTIPSVPTFKTEDSLWQMLADGSKTWDARKFDPQDERIHRLARWTHGPALGEDKRRGLESTLYHPKENWVAFQNKASGQVATFAYEGMVMQEWAPGWCFLLLGQRIEEIAHATL